VAARAEPAIAKQRRAARSSGRTRTDTRETRQRWGMRLLSVSCRRAHVLVTGFACGQFEPRQMGATNGDDGLRRACSRALLVDVARTDEPACPGPEDRGLP